MNGRGALCPRCGRTFAVHLARTPDLRVKVESADRHICDRFLLAEYWERGRNTRDDWSSEVPGRTGPWSLVPNHSAQAKPRFLCWTWQGFTYRWQSTDPIEVGPYTWTGAGELA